MSERDIEIERGGVSSGRDSERGDLRGREGGREGETVSEGGRQRDRDDGCQSFKTLK